MSKVLAITSMLTVLAAMPTPVQAFERPNCDAARASVQTQLDAACPCDTAATHAEYVRCVNDKLRKLSACPKDADGKLKCGPVPRACVANLRRTAARSGCGDVAVVSCCIPRQHDCVNDTKPGDGKQEGKCSGTQKPCDTLADCRIPTCRQASSADRCTTIGGTLGKSKDCSTACEP